MVAMVLSWYSNPSMSILRHVSKSERTDNVCHAPFFSPLLHRLDECGRYFEVVEGNRSIQSGRSCIPIFIGMAIDDSGYASYYLSVSV